MENLPTKDLETEYFDAVQDLYDSAYAVGSSSHLHSMFMISFANVVALRTDNVGNDAWNDPSMQEFFTNLLFQINSINEAFQFNVSADKEAMDEILYEVSMVVSINDRLLRKSKKTPN